MVKAILAFLLVLTIGIITELLGMAIDVHYGAIVAVALMEAFIICEINKNKK